MATGADIRAQNQDDLYKVTGVPDKIRKQSDVVANALKSLRVQELRLMTRVKELEAGNVTLAGQVKAKTEEHSTTAGTLQRAKIAMEQKERTVDDIRKDLEREGLGCDQHLADQVDAPAPLHPTLVHPHTPNLPNPTLYALNPKP
jgi:hypothetical protein